MLITAGVIFLVTYGICAQSPASRVDDASAVGSTTINPCSNDIYDSIDRRKGEYSGAEEIPCPTESGCGYSNKGEFPWIVAILEVELIMEELSSDVYKCSGSLIHPIVVLTAAHCVSKIDEKDLKIRAGQSLDERDDSYERQVSRSIIHEHYQRRGLVNDVALLFLNEAFQISNIVNTICLPPPNQVELQRCFVSGWKREKVDESEKSKTFLKIVELPIVGRDKCLVELRQTKFGRNYELHKSFICAGGEIAKNTCEADGDVGSPLVCPMPNTVNRYHQIGIVSWGFGLGNSMPGIYVNVPLFTNWIKEQLER